MRSQVLKSGISDQSWKRAAAVAARSSEPRFLWLVVGYLASASVAFCLILLIRQISLGAVAVVIPVLAVFHLTLRASFGRLEDAHRHLADVDRLYLSTI